MKELIHRITKALITRPNFFDWLVYRLFRRVWNPILRDHPNMRVGLGVHLLSFDAKNTCITLQRATETSATAD